MSSLFSRSRERDVKGKNDLPDLRDPPADPANGLGQRPEKMV